jgi:hypothetical protein
MRHNHEHKYICKTSQNLCSHGPGTEVTSPEVYEGIDSEQYVFPALKDVALYTVVKSELQCPQWG